MSQFTMTYQDVVDAAFALRTFCNMTQHAQWLHDHAAQIAAIVDQPPEPDDFTKGNY